MRKLLSQCFYHIKLFGNFRERLCIEFLRIKFVRILLGLILQSEGVKSDWAPVVSGVQREPSSAPCYSPYT